jgi:hypothetical protein
VQLIAISSVTPPSPKIGFVRGFAGLIIFIDAEGAIRTGSCLTTGNFYPASGLMIPTEMVAVPAERVTVCHRYPSGYLEPEFVPLT